MNSLWLRLLKADIPVTEVDRFWNSGNPVKQIEVGSTVQVFLFALCPMILTQLPAIHFQEQIEFSFGEGYHRVFCLGHFF